MPASFSSHAFPVLTNGDQSKGCTLTRSNHICSSARCFAPKRRLNESAFAGTRTNISPCLHPSASASPIVGKHPGSDQFHEPLRFQYTATDGEDPFVQNRTIKTAPGRVFGESNVKHPLPLPLMLIELESPTPVPVSTPNSP